MESDEHAPRPAISIKKRVDCLKLRVQKTRLDNGQGPIFIVHIILKIGKRFMHRIYRRRCKSRVVGPSSSNPVLSFTKLARIRKVSSSGFVHQFFVKFSDEPQS